MIQLNFLNLIFIINILIIIIGGILLFFERKLIAILQKRLGISFFGRNGWAHLPADIIKFWLKNTNKYNSSWFSLTSNITITIFTYLNWCILSIIFMITDNGSVAFDFWDFQLLAFFTYANLSSLFLANIANMLKSKYAILASTRLLLLASSLEVFFIIVFLFLWTHIGGYSFDELSTSNWLFFSIPPLAALFFIYILFEAKRAPFDHSEAESELVAGHLIEFGGRSLLLMFICEYIHVFMCLFLFCIIIFGGLSTFSFFSYFPFWYNLIF